MNMREGGNQEEKKKGREGGMREGERLVVSMNWTAASRKSVYTTKGISCEMSNNNGDNSNNITTKVWNFILCIYLAWHQVILASSKA